MKFVILYFVCGFFLGLVCMHYHIKSGRFDALRVKYNMKYREQVTTKDLAGKLIICACIIVYSIIWPYIVIRLVITIIKGIRHYN